MYNQEIIVWKTGRNPLAVGNLSIGAIFDQWSFLNICEMGNKGYIKIIKQFKLFVFFYQKIGISVYIYFVWSISVNSILKNEKKMA